MALVFRRPAHQELERNLKSLRRINGEIITKICYRNDRSINFAIAKEERERAS
jgi:hypothetical protein